MAGPSTYVGLLTGVSEGTAGAGTPTATSGDGAGAAVAQPAALSSAETVVQPAAGAAVGATGPAVASGSGARPAVSAARNIVSSVGHAIAACLPRIVTQR